MYKALVADKKKRPTCNFVMNKVDKNLPSTSTATKQKKKAKKQKGKR